ncbi:MAG: type II CAAX endopeptidase family protein [Candidatus Hydrogenedentes bacterium]|nr:type II CAAX endopeptidase family protein [Candidatus Hydrogenedentota bacterium]
MTDRLAQYVKTAFGAIQAEAHRIGFRWRVTLVVATVVVLLLLPSYHKGAWFLDGLRWIGGEPFARQARSFGINYRLLLDVFVPLVVLALMGQRFRDYGLGLGKVKKGLALSLLFYVIYIPCFIVLFSNPGFQQYYDGVTKHYQTWQQFLVRETVIVTLLSLRTEFLFRGFLLFGVKREYGAYAGILVQVMPYVLVHAGKAEMEALGSLGVGLALGWLAVKTESIWYGVVLHGSIALLFNVFIFTLNR